MKKLRYVRVVQLLSILLLLAGNQLLRSPYHLWNMKAEVDLFLSGYTDAVYESNLSKIEVIERLPFKVENGVSMNDGLVLIIPDITSSIGLWAPALKSIESNKTIRFVRWFGRGQSDWKGNVILFSDVHSLLDVTLSDVTKPVTIVGQGMGAQIAIQYAEANPDKVAKIIAIAPDGFSARNRVPRVARDVEGYVRSRIGEVGFPNFIAEDWLEWLNEPYTLALEKESHLSNRFQGTTDFSKVAFVGTVADDVQTMNDTVSVPLLTECLVEVAWNCPEQFVKLLQ